MKPTITHLEIMKENTSLVVLPEGMSSYFELISETLDEAGNGVFELMWRWFLLVKTQESVSFFSGVAQERGEKTSDLVVDQNGNMLSNEERLSKITELLLRGGGYSEKEKNYLTDLDILAGMMLTIFFCSTPEERLKEMLDEILSDPVVMATYQIS